MVENLFKESFKVLDGMPKYIGIEERDSADYDYNNWKDKINTLNDFAIQNKLSRISALINRTSEQCMYASDNSPTSLTMDEHLNIVKNEIGENWSKSCNVIYLEDKPVGISIPHIERGTVDEGRLFYFGILPEERGKGHSVSIHYQSMNLLKEMGATYYIGSTHETNKKMQKVFLKSGCSIKAETESYYKYISN